MNREDLYYSISDISPEFIEELNESTEKKKHSLYNNRKSNQYVRREPEVLPYE